MSNHNISNAHFHHIALKASDFNRSLKFYTEGLGFTVFKTWGEEDSRAAMLDMGDGGYVELFAGGEKVEARKRSRKLFSSGNRHRLF